MEGGLPERTSRLVLFSIVCNGRGEDVTICFDLEPAKNTRGIRGRVCERFLESKIFYSKVSRGVIRMLYDRLYRILVCASAIVPQAYGGPAESSLAINNESGSGTSRYTFNVRRHIFIIIINIVQYVVFQLGVFSTNKFSGQLSEKPG